MTQHETTGVLYTSADLLAYIEKQQQAERELAEAEQAEQLKLRHDRKTRLLTQAAAALVLAQGVIVWQMI